MQCFWEEVVFVSDVLASSYSTGCYLDFWGKKGRHVFCSGAKPIGGVVLGEEVG